MRAAVYGTAARMQDHRNLILLVAALFAVSGLMAACDPFKDA